MIQENVWVFTKHTCYEVRGLQGNVLQTSQIHLISQYDLPKNLDRYTLMLIWRFISKQSGAVSATEVAVGVGVSRSTARRYLEFCLEQGLVKRTMSYLTVGRPRHRFKVL